MPRYFMYIPWEGDQRLANNAFLWTDRLAYQKSKQAKDNVLSSQYLHAVEPDDALYIAGHGAPGDEHIYGTKSGFKLTAAELAAQFKGKLNRNHKRIKVWVCFSGDGMTHKRGLAYRFWEAMRKDFPQLTVFGYRYAVLDPLQRTQEHLSAAVPLPGFESVLKTPDLLKELPGTAKHWRTGIDPAGNIIPPKPLPRTDPHSGSDEDL